jgi:GNAT superfamily N-acetyltransferase
MTTSITIRLASVDDIPALGDLIISSVTELSRSYYTDDEIESGLLHIFGVDSQLISDETYFIAESEGVIAGAGGWSKRLTLYGGDQTKGREPDRLLDPGTEPGRVRAFYIHPGWARRGVATLILQACEDAARLEGFRSLELAATLPGVPFYRARGYDSGDEISIQTPGGTILKTLRMTRFLF